MKKPTNDVYIDRLERFTPKDFVMVINTSTQEIIGKVLNFNESGMQLLMDNTMALNEILELSLVFKNAQNEKQYIDVIAELLWIKKAETHENMVGGFYLSSKNFKSKFRLNQVLKSFK